MTSISKSHLWGKMQDYYSNIGLGAWSDEVVPMQISSNKSLAAAYANVILAHINDYYTANPQAKDNIEPFHIVEVGAGHARLSFYIVKQLMELLPIFGYPLNSIKYIVTDIAPINVQAWEEHSAFNQFMQDGIVDTAIFNAMTDTSLALRQSGLVLQANSLQKPVFMIGNYLFDSLANDGFQAQSGQLLEAQIKIKSSADWKEYFDKAKFEFTYSPVATNYYNDQELDKILADYVAHFNPEGSFVLPIGGIACMRTVERFSKSPMVLLLADKACADLSQLADLSDPDIASHGGSISMIVNYDALARFTRQKGGTALLMPNSSSDFQVGCFINKDSYPIGHTRHSFMQNFAGASPQDVINICYNEDEIKQKYESLDHILSILNLNHWDPNIFFDLYEIILDKLENETLTMEQNSCFMQNLPLLWSYFFKLEKNNDLAFAIGAIYYAIDEYELANKYYNISLVEFGANADNLYNLAISLQLLEKLEEAKEHALQALSLDPDYSAAQELLDEIQAEFVES